MLCEGQEGLLTDTWWTFSEPPPNDCSDENLDVGGGGSRGKCKVQ